MLLRPTKVRTLKPYLSFIPIILAVESINYSHLNSAKSAKEAWDRLQCAFEDKGLTRRVGLLRKLVTTQLSNSKSVDGYVNTIMDTTHKLNEIGFTVSEEWTGTLLLAGLPDEYKPMIMGIESSGVKITGDSIKMKLLQDVKDDMNPPKSADSDSALYSNTHFTKRKPPRCYQCKRIGHVSKHCPNKNSSANGRKFGNPSNGSGNKVFLAFLSSDKMDREGAWYLDSGASTHLTRNPDLLIESKSKTDARITAANNCELISDSIGSVPIHVSNGREQSTVIAKDVLYVPGSAANLMSVSKIVQKGHSVVFDSTGAKIRDNDGGIVAIATETDGIYKMISPKPRPPPQAGFLCQSTIGDLYHRRLGHLNRKAMSYLKKMSTGLDHMEITKNPCKMCITGKHARLPFDKSNCDRLTFCKLSTVMFVDPWRQPRSVAVNIS